MKQMNEKNLTELIIQLQQAVIILQLEFIKLKRELKTNK
jgi:hypothetical protein